MVVTTLCANGKDKQQEATKPTLARNHGTLEIQLGVQTRLSYSYCMSCGRPFTFGIDNGRMVDICQASHGTTIHEHFSPFGKGLGIRHGDTCHRRCEIYMPRFEMPVLSITCNRRDATNTSTMFLVRTTANLVATGGALLFQDWNLLRVSTQT